MLVRKAETDFILSPELRWIQNSHRCLLLWRRLFPLTYGFFVGHWRKMHSNGYVNNSMYDKQAACPDKVGESDYECLLTKCACLLSGRYLCTQMCGNIALGLLCYITEWVLEMLDGKLCGSSRRAPDTLSQLYKNWLRELCFCTGDR